MTSTNSSTVPGKGDYSKEKYTATVTALTPEEVVVHKAKDIGLSTTKKCSTAEALATAIASLVCGILGLFLFYLAVPALVFGIISLGKIEEEKYYRKGKGMAIAGIVLGGLVILAFILIIGFFALIFGAN